MAFYSKKLKRPDRESHDTNEMLFDEKGTGVEKRRVLLLHRDKNLVPEGMCYVLVVKKFIKTKESGDIFKRHFFFLKLNRIRQYISDSHVHPTPK